MDLTLEKTSFVRLKRGELNSLLDRARREGRGEVKGEVFAILEEARYEPKDKVTVTYLTKKVQDL